jgi:hypothetical protein
MAAGKICFASGRWRWGSVLKVGEKSLPISERGARRKQKGECLRVRMAMKEIDFLPDWYKQDRRRQMSYRTQYFALGGVFVVVMAWNFVTTHSVSRAIGQLVQQRVKQAEAATALFEYAEVKGQVTELQKRVEVLKEIDSKIDVASILAELSFLIDERIVLSKVEITAERLAEKEQSKPKTGAVVRVAAVRSKEKHELPLGDVRFKVVIDGVAAHASDVAGLTTRLENSPYFCLVYLSFSRPMEAGSGRTSMMDRRIPQSDIPNDVRAETKLASSAYQASEFEIGCYLANYETKMTLDDRG